MPGRCWALYGVAGCGAVDDGSPSTEGAQVSEGTPGKIEELATCTAHGSKVFTLTKAPVNWTVPTCVTSVTIDAGGAQGGDGARSNQYNPAPGGLGGHVTATFKVTAGSALQIHVGGRGSSGDDAVRSGGYNGGGQCGSSEGCGGGASDIRIKPFSTSDRILVAAGGGGAAYTQPGGAGGGLVGNDGCSDQCDGSQGHGATQTAGGGGGAYSEYPYALASEDGSVALGGQGGQCRNDNIEIDTIGGSGGGGWFGGGGGCDAAGGGGSSYIKTSLLVSGKSTVNQSGARNGDGFVTLTW